MKTTTITKYQTSDGRVFEKQEIAQLHELTTTFQALAGEGVKLTAQQVFRLMIANHQTVIEKLGEVAGE